MMGKSHLLVVVILSVCTDIALSTDCEAGKFGAGCAFVCNCDRLNNCDQTSTSVGCSGDCSDGYTGKPACQTGCDGFHFGVNCAIRCHCRPSVRCSRFNGQCADGNCDPLYYSSNCQLRKTQLTAPPNVTLNDCSGLTVTWTQFRWGVDPGSANVTEYKVRAHYASNSLLLGTLKHKANSLTNQLKLSGVLNVSQSYAFTVTPVFQYLGVDLDGVTTAMSDAVARLCDKTPPSPAEPTIKATKDFGLLVSWSVKEHAAQLTTVQVQWAQLRYGECEITSQPTETARVAFSNGSLFLNVSAAWTQYNVTMVGIDAEGLNSAAVRWLQYTAEEEPAGTVANLIAVAAETIAFIRWAPPTCVAQGGLVVNYHVEVLKLPDNTQISLPGGHFLPATTLGVNMTGLTSRTTYKVSVRYQTASGTSKVREVDFTTNGTAPSAPTKLRIDSIGESWARLEWTKPNVAPAGTTYTVTITPRTPSTLNTSELFVNVTDLLSQTKYTAQVHAVFGGTARGESNLVEFTFRDNIGSWGMSGLEGSVSVSSDSVQIQWVAPNGGIAPSSYRITATPTNKTLLPSSDATTVVKTAAGGTLSYDVTGLRPATQYSVVLVPVYPVDMSGAPSTPSTFWTCPGPMTADLPTPVVKSTTQSSFQLILKPVDYTGGPLEYYLFLSAPSARRKRAVSASSLGLPAGSHFISRLEPPTANGSVVSIASTTVGGSTTPLAADTAYRAHLAAVSAVGPRRVYKTSSADVRTAAAAPAGSLAWIAAVVILLLFLLVLIVVLVLLWRRRKNQPLLKEDQSLQLSLHSSEKSPGRLLAPQFFKNWSDTERLNDARFVVLDPEYGPRDLKVESLRNREEAHDYESFEKEYRSLPNGLEKSCSAGRMPENQPKNRNPSILPYDHCRVTLDRAETSEPDATDYINASYVDGYLRKRAYIAAQSPFDDATVADFWLMIYQANVQQVVMMTEMLEEATVKCTQYWPECGHAEQFGDVLVTTTEEEQLAFYTVRKLQIQLRGRANSAAQPLRQYQFHGWPEHGVPSSPIPLLELYTRVKMDMRAHMGPLVVHCGTGISRTAVFVALDSLLQQAIHENVVNVYKFCVRLRRCRPNMVRTARQYMFLYDLIFESLLASNQIANLDVRETFRQLSGKNPSTGHSFLWEQHCLLEKYTPRPGPCDAGRLNAARNRFPTILPADEHRVRLSGPDYINAVFVDGVFAQDELILTQTPLAETRADLWRMLAEQRASVVVDMEAEHRGREAAVDWYPAAGLALTVEPGLTLHAGPVAEPPALPGVCVREVTVSGGRHPVRVFSLLPGVWSDPYAKVPTDRTALLSLVQAVRAEESRTGPVAVVCVDGATRSGLFATCFLAAQKLSSDHYVDVFRTVKAVKLRRYQVVPHLEQYKLIFKLLWDFVRRYMAEELRKEMASHGLSGHLPEGDLESVYSHTQLPVLHIEQQGTLGSSGVHYRYANAENV